jgi:hypothetical protein
MRRFNLIRDQDLSGVSGTGIVAEGVEFEDGTCVMSWLTKYHTVGTYPNIKVLVAVHGHEGRTRITWIDGPPSEETP